MISGPPGAGKTTLAIPLARLLGFALITKDIIKETLYDTLGPRPGDFAFSRQIGGAAMETLWALAAKQDAAVIEANFRPRSAYERAKVAGLRAHVVEVYCRCPPAEAARRFAARAESPTHHPAHYAKAITEEDLAEFDQPMHADAVEIDTTGPVNIEALARSITARFDALR